MPDDISARTGDADADGDDDNDAERRDELDDDAEGSADGQPEEDDAALAGAEPTAEDSTTQPDSADQTEVDQADGGADDGEAGGEGQQDGDAKQSDADPSRDTSKSAGTAAQQADAAERDAAQEAGGEDEEEQAEESAEAPPMATSADGTGPSKQKTQSDAAAETSLDRPSDRSDAAPQAQRSLGDSLRDWRRRLEEIGDLAQPESAADDQQPSSNKEDGAVEFVQEGDEHETDEQALGPANEEQVKKLEQLHIGEETAPNDAMPVDEDDSPEQPLDAPSQQAASTLDLKGSTLAEADAKAVTAADLQDRETRPAELSDDDEMEDVQRAEAGEQHSIFAPPVDPEEDISVEQTMLRWRSGDDQALSADGVWRLYESLTRDLSFALTEQLRLILEPTLATRLKGDYRSGKRLNMKKIIPYIASEFTKDKIWLRRTRPSQREYQVLIAIDDSKSMADSHSVHLAFQSLALISRALTRLEVGGISVCRFGEDVDVLHPFEAGSVSDDAGAELISKFTFSQRSTDVRLLVERTLAQLAEAKDSARSGKSSLQAGDLWQLAVLISDGCVFPLIRLDLQSTHCLSCLSQHVPGPRQAARLAPTSGGAEGPVCLRSHRLPPRPRASRRLYAAGRPEPALYPRDEVCVVCRRRERPARAQDGPLHRLVRFRLPALPRLAQRRRPPGRALDSVARLFRLDCAWRPPLRASFMC